MALIVYCMATVSLLTQRFLLVTGEREYLSCVRY